MTEAVAGQSEHVQYFSSKRREKGRQKIKFSQNTSNASGKKTPGRISRRTLLRTGAIAVAVAVGGAVGVKEIVDTQRHAADEQLYQGWERYKNATLPSDLVAKIGTSIKESDYPGFSEVGDIIIKSQSEYRSLDQFYPGLSHPMQIALAETVETEGALADFKLLFNGSRVDVFATDKNTNKKKKAALLDPESIDPAKVDLDNSIFLASNTAKKLLFVKEFSHFLYIKELRDIITKDVAKQFEIDTSAKAPVGDLLVINSYLVGSLQNPSPFGYHYDNGRTLLDYAGFFHIMPTMGIAIKTNALTPDDQQTLYSAIDAFNEAKRRGLLLEPSKGKFVWKEGIGPFNQEWIDIMKNIFMKEGK